MYIILGWRLHSLGTLTSTDIDHLIIMKSSVSPTSKRGGITDESDPRNATVHGNLTPPDPYIGSIGSNTKTYKETILGMPDSLN